MYTGWDDYDMVTTYLKGFLLCASIHRYSFGIDFSDFPKKENAITKSIECLIKDVEL